MAEHNVFTTVPDAASTEQMSEYLDVRSEELELPMKLAMRFHVVADEIWSNIVYYSGAKTATLSCETGDGRAMLIFTDDGTAYDPTGQTTPEGLDATAEEREVGGLGIHMVRKMSDELKYERIEGKNVLTVAWDLE